MSTVVRGRVRIDGRLDYESFRLRDDEPCVAAAQAAVRRCDANPVRAVSDGGLDANWLTARGYPRSRSAAARRTATPFPSGSI